jgi:hypothetical protein
MSKHIENLKAIGMLLLCTGQTAYEYALKNCPTTKQLLKK